MNYRKTNYQSRNVKRSFSDSVRFTCPSNPFEHRKVLQNPFLDIGRYEAVKQYSILASRMTEKS